jgi:hexosaminidase
MLLPKDFTMKNRLTLVAFLAAAFCVFGNSVRAETPSLIPLPQKISIESGAFEIKPDTPIMVEKDSPDAMNVAKLFAERIRNATGVDLKISTVEGDAKHVGAICIQSKKSPETGTEGYRLEVSPEGVVIVGGGGPGMFYGTQTLLQLLPPEIYCPKKAEKTPLLTVPAVKIEDKPRFQWRGLMLDVSRHFFSKEEVKNFLDLMAQHKLNTFHWHLSDDVGWRIEIKKYPKLTEIGAWRSGINYDLDPKASTAYDKDGRYGGFYTQDDIREIVGYAKARYITIIPEIDIPGHSAGALSAYPEYTCSGNQLERDSGTMGVYCPGNDKSFEFIENVLSEVIDLFPGKYFHIGGDEVWKDYWKNCPKCSERIKSEKLKDVDELQSYFVKRIEKFLNGKNRTLIGWDEILEGGLAPNATVMSWRGVAGGIVAANAGHDVVMTPGPPLYLDHYQAKTGEPKAIGGFSPLKDVYCYEPVPSEIPADKAHHVLGAGGNLWSEYFPNYAHVQYMAYPRACALAELTWTEPKLKNWDDFKHRMETQFERLKVQKVNFRATRQDDPGF